MLSGPRTGANIRTEIQLLPQFVEGAKIFKVWKLICNDFRQTTNTFIVGDDYPLSSPGPDLSSSIIIFVFI